MSAAKISSARALRESSVKERKTVVGVFATGDPRIDKESRERARNIVKMVADKVAAGAPDVEVVYSQTLVDGERQADSVARAFLDNQVQILVCAPDTWAFPQLSAISLFAHFPSDTPINLTCGNSGPKPGVVFAHALNGALAQYGRLAHINVGSWPDTGMNPVMSDSTEKSLIDWVYAAAAAVSLKGKRVMVFGHDSMGMETALAHVLPTRNAYGIEITRLDMKLLADMLAKKSYDKAELKELRAWIDKMVGKRLVVPTKEDSEIFDQSLAMYLIVRDLMKDAGAVAGGFMSQLEWGSDRRGIPLPVADAMESLFNSSFDHNGPKRPLPFGTEADMQGILTMLFHSELTAGNPPLFMDFRKVWEPWEVKKLADSLKVKYSGKEKWAQKGFVDGDNSGSASLDWAALPGADVKKIMSGVSMPLADTGYFPGRGNSVTYVSPAGIEGVAGRLAYSSLSGMFTMFWDEAETISMPEKLSEKVRSASSYDWPHTYVCPKYASMYEYKHFAPANHFHMIWGLSPARLEFWMDLTNTLSGNMWTARPQFVEGVDRPVPLLYLENGGEAAAKMLLKK
jgi:L-fucose isomerase